MKIKTTRFGEINVPNECIICFDSGLIGLPKHKKFALFPYDEDGPFNILQSVNEPDLSFLLVDPYSFFNGYVFELQDEIAAELGFTPENPPGVYALTTMRGKIENATINLLGPLLVNWKNRTAVQVTLQNSPFGLRQPLFPEGLKLSRKLVVAIQNWQTITGMETETRLEAIG